MVYEGLEGLMRVYLVVYEGLEWLMGFRKFRGVYEGLLSKPFNTFSSSTFSQ